eukprot:706340-Rhodomonas_salina.1
MQERVDARLLVAVCADWRRVSGVGERVGHANHVGWLHCSRCLHLPGCRPLPQRCARPSSVLTDTTLLPDAAATGCTATVISNAMCSPTPVPETDPTETVEPEWTCQKGATASECFGAVIGAYETAQMARRDAREMVWTCDDATAVQADVADCFAVNECCGADWAAWTDFWLDTQFDGCDFGTCVEAANKVAFTARLSVTKAAFDANTNDVMTKYKSAVATAAGNDVSVADVIITGTTDQSTRRRLLADAVDIDTEVRTGSASAATAVIAAMTQDNLNTALVGVGLDAGSITGAPAVKEIPTTDSAGHAVPSMMMALGAVFASLAFLFQSSSTEGCLLDAVSRCTPLSHARSRERLWVRRVLAQTNHLARLLRPRQSSASVVGTRVSGRRESLSRAGSAAGSAIGWMSEPRIA